MERKLQYYAGKVKEELSVYLSHYDCEVQTWIDILTDLKKQHGEVIVNREQDYDGEYRLAFYRLRAETPDEAFERKQQTKAEQQQRERWERDQYLALKKKFEGGK